MKENKKNVMLNVKIEEDIKKRFIAVAKNNDENCSMLIRKFIKDYLVKNQQLTLKM